jgi:tetratricopeptide (TPR) repeat protein
LGRLIELEPQNASYYNFRGKIHDSMKNYNQALKDYSEAIKFDPIQSFNYFCRGLTYYKIQNTNLAMIDFTKAIKLNPKYADAYEYRAAALNRAGNYVEAI